MSVKFTGGFGPIILPDNTAPGDVTTTFPATHAALTLDDGADVGPTHPELVAALVKRPSLIRETLSCEKVDLIHAVLGISGEAGELLDAIKKHAIYNKPIDLENVIEELGDLEFYIEQLRQRLVITREETLEHNIAKLSVRYAGLNYSDAAAQERADKR